MFSFTDKLFLFTRSSRNFFSESLKSKIFFLYYNAYDLHYLQ